MGFSLPSWWLATASVAPTGPGPADNGLRDDLFLALIGAALEGTGAFAAVVVGAPPEAAELPAAPPSAAWIWQDGWADRVAATGPIYERTLRFSLAAEARDADPGRAYRLAKQLEALVLNALNPAAVLGNEVRGSVLVGRGDRDPKAGHPSHRLRLQGTLLYNWTALDTTDPE